MSADINSEMHEIKKVVKSGTPTLHQDILGVVKGGEEEEVEVVLVLHTATPLPAQLHHQGGQVQEPTTCTTYASPLLTTHFSQLSTVPATKVKIKMRQHIINFITCFPLCP